MINIFISNCNLISQSFPGTVIDYSYICFYIILLNLTSYSPTLAVNSFVCEDKSEKDNLVEKHTDLLEEESESCFILNNSKRCE